MKDILSRLSREPNLILGVITAGLSLAVLFGVAISTEQMAGIGIFIGAVFALVRYLTTPAGEVLASVKPNGDVIAGGKIPELKGQLVEVTVGPSHQPAENPPNHDHPLP